MFQVKVSELVRIVPKSPVITARRGDAATEDNITVVPLTRGVQACASRLVRIVPIPPVTINVPPNTPTPCNSFVVGLVLWFQTSPSRLTSLVMYSPMRFVLTRLVWPPGLQR